MFTPKDNTFVKFESRLIMRSTSQSKHSKLIPAAECKHPAGARTRGFCFSRLSNICYGFA